MIDVTNKTIGELALETPNAIPVMERWQIDYCCRGGRPVAEACSDAGITVSELLEAIGDARTEGAMEWDGRSLADLQQFIVSTHHLYTRQSLDTVAILADKVARRHGPGHPEVLEVHALSNAMTQDLIPHMMKEEQVLFPYIEQLESAAGTGDSPASCFGTVQNPIRAMMNEHEAVGEILVKLRAATKDYTLPEDACLSFRALYERLADLEQDLHRHIHLENNLLFPRAVQLEETGSSQPVVEKTHDSCSCA